MSGPAARRPRSESEIDFGDALNRLRQAGLRLPSGPALEALRRDIGAEALAARPISELLCGLAVGERLTAEFEPGALDVGALCPDLLALLVSREARIDPAEALTALARLSNQSARLSSGVQTLRPGDGFEYLRFGLDGAAREIAIDATAGFDPAAELTRLARILETGRKAFYLHRRGALLLILHLHEESAEALNAAEPGVLEALTSVEVDLPLFRLSRKNLRRLPVVLAAIVAIIIAYASAP